MMDKWRRLSIPPICERMISFSIPTDQTILVVSYEGTHLVHLGDEVTVETDEEFIEYDIYDPQTGIANYRGIEYQIIGLQGGSPLLQSPYGEQLVLDTKAESLSLIQNGRIVFVTSYENFSGDWAAATFSSDGRYITLGCPYDFDFVVLE